MYSKTVGLTTYVSIISTYVHIVVDCNQPKDGFRNHVLTPNGTTFNAVAEYICDEGYIIYGNDKRTCLSSGEWSGSVIHCAGRFLLVLL